MKLKLSFSGHKIEAGCDEAGRGCLAGPVVAAAVILPDGFKNELLNDSKLLSEKKREALVPIIKKEAIAYGIGVVDHLESQQELKTRYTSAAHCSRQSRLNIECSATK